MRTRLMQDVLAEEGVAWVALIGPDALPIDYLPKDSDVDSAVAMWTGVDSLVTDTPAKMLVKTSESFLVSQRVDEDRILLTLTDLNINIGNLRRTLSNTAERIIDLN